MVCHEDYATREFFFQLLWKYADLNFFSSTFLGQGHVSEFLTLHSESRCRRQGGEREALERAGECGSEAQRKKIKEGFVTCVLNLSVADSLSFSFLSRS